MPHSHLETIFVFLWPFKFFWGRFVLLLQYMASPALLLCCVVTMMMIIIEDVGRFVS